MSGADNQQERLSVETISVSLGSFLAGFALGEASFMVICRRRDDYARKWKVSAAFNVSQKDRAPLDSSATRWDAEPSDEQGTEAGTGRSID